MDVILFKTIEREILDLNFEIDEIADEITDADDDLDINALVERRKQLERRRRADLQIQIVLNLIR